MLHLNGMYANCVNDALQARTEQVQQGNRGPESVSNILCRQAAISEIGWRQAKI